MSQENVEIIERAVAAINARDLDGYLACCTADIELHTPLAVVGGVYEGPTGIRRWFTDLEDVGPDFRIELERVKTLRPSRVLAFLRITRQDQASSKLHGSPRGPRSRGAVGVDRARVGWHRRTATCPRLLGSVVEKAETTQRGTGRDRPGRSGDPVTPEEPRRV